MLPPAEKLFKGKKDITGRGRCQYKSGLYKPQVEIFPLLFAQPAPLTSLFPRRDALLRVVEVPPRITQRHARAPTLSGG